jgi:adenosylhomocysteinase
MENYDVKDMRLAEGGRRRIDWAEREMPVLRLIRDRFTKERPLSGLKVAACLHVTTETANLMNTLHLGGAEVILTASNPLSTQDDVAASLVTHFEIPVYAIKGEDNVTYYKHINAALDVEPHMTMDDGADLVSVHKERRNYCQVVMAQRETTAGVIRLQAMAVNGALNFPVMAVNDAMTSTSLMSLWLGNLRWMASFAPPISCWLRPLSWLDTAGAGAAWQCGRAAWAPM